MVRELQYKRNGKDHSESKRSVNAIYRCKQKLIFACTNLNIMLTFLNDIKCNFISEMKSGLTRKPHEPPYVNNRPTENSSTAIGEFYPNCPIGFAITMKNIPVSILVKSRRYPVLVLKMSNLTNFIDCF